MGIRVGINGMGRVGRAYLRRSAQIENVEGVVVNDVVDAVALPCTTSRPLTWIA